MNRTIIFISGMGVPKFIAKTHLVWNDPFWEGYRRIYVTSKIPTSDKMVKSHLKELTSLINKFPNVTVAGQSLGGWWTANLACEPSCKMKKAVLLTPLCHAEQFPIFNVSPLFNPLNRTVNKEYIGPHKTLILGAENDFIVPINHHALWIKQHLSSTFYKLDGGHFIQKNHQAALSFAKDWIELD